MYRSRSKILIYVSKSRVSFYRPCHARLALQRCRELLKRDEKDTSRRGSYDRREITSKENFLFKGMWSCASHHAAAAGECGTYQSHRRQRIKGAESCSVTQHEPQILTDRSSLDQIESYLPKSIEFARSDRIGNSASELGRLNSRS